MKAEDFWEDTLRYLYLQRLKTSDSLGQAIRTGSASTDFFGIAYGQDGESFEGFQFGSSSSQVYKTLLLIEPDIAKRYQDELIREAEAKKAQIVAGADRVRE